jgi:hypothetical protein
MILSVVCVAASVPFTVGMEWLNAKTVARERKEAADNQPTDTNSDVGMGMMDANTSGRET